MKKTVLIIFILFLTISCNDNSLVGEYNCERSNGKYGSVLRFKTGGKLFLDLVPNDIVERNPDLGGKLNVAGEYEIIDDQVVIKYFEGFQTHTLTKIGDKLTSNSDIFKLCTCQTK
ncbi:hypothetical protein [Aquimarina sp. AU474]|uniref:hypothetical protein n=1 Tax=Aquimarina sp. AU474 TaxID=2108529 RepID=UPI000D69D6C9|nr:hypothetical protein [Aquimarina sp. AU474]